MKSSKKGVTIILNRFKDVLVSDPLDDETQDGNGYWWYLKPGYITSDGMHLVHEMTIANCYGKLSNVKSCTCDDCQKQLEKDEQKMSTNPVVSFMKAIREAVGWIDLPLPQMSVDGVFPWPNGQQSCSYCLTWDRDTIEAFMGESITHDGSAGYCRFRQCLQDCFCGDITVVELWSHQPDNRIQAKLYCGGLHTL